MESAQFSNNSGNDLAKLYSQQPGLVPIDDFNKEDRERVLELLLSQERVVSLLYAKAFPVNVASAPPGSSPHTGAVPGRPMQNGLNLAADHGDAVGVDGAAASAGLGGGGDHSTSHGSLHQQDRPVSGSGQRPSTSDASGTRLPALQTR